MARPGTRVASVLHFDGVVLSINELEVGATARTGVECVDRDLGGCECGRFHAGFAGENRTPRQPVDGQNVGSQ